MSAPFTSRREALQELASRLTADLSDPSAQPGDVQALLTTSLKVLANEPVSLYETAGENPRPPFHFEP